MLLAATERQRQVVVACCARAAQAGVRRGLPVSEARALLPGVGVRVEPHEPARDAVALRALAVWAHRLCPIVSVDEPDGLLMDVTGCERVFGGERRLVERVIESLRGLGFVSRVAMAPTFGCAWGVARFGGVTASIIPDGGAGKAMAGLPVAALRLETPTIEALAEVGVERVEHVMALPRAGLPSRFADDVLLRLDESLGQAIETVQPVRPSGLLRVARAFDGPTTQWEAISITVRELLDALCGMLLARENGALRVVLELERADLPPAVLTLSLCAPTRDMRHLWMLASPRLEKIQLGFGVEGVTITAPRTARIAHRQEERWIAEGEHADGEGEAARLLDTLANRLGADRVLAADPCASHVPERAFVLRRATESRGRHAEAERLPDDRPTRMLTRPTPVPVIALSPDGPVMSFRLHSEEHQVAACIGPERIGPEWWRGDRLGRDYFKVQDTEGRWFWLFRESRGGGWFLHGEWA